MSMLVLCNVISVIFYSYVRISFVMVTYCVIDNTFVLCLVILVLQSNNDIVGLAVLVCNNLILVCNVILLVL